MRIRDAFDARYTSTPYVLKLPGRYVLYYSARDMLEGWLQADGTPGPGRGFAYRHIGLSPRSTPPRTQIRRSATRGLLTENRYRKAGILCAFARRRAERTTSNAKWKTPNGNAEYSWKVVVGG